MMAAMVAAGEKVRQKERHPMSSRKVRSAVIVLVLVNFVASAAYALPPTGRQALSGPEGVLASAWEWFTSLLAPVGEARGQVNWEKAGSQMDPNGASQSAALVSGETTDAGSQMDPDGNQ
jgi:hypothetical protein